MRFSLRGALCVLMLVFVFFCASAYAAPTTFNINCGGVPYQNKSSDGQTWHWSGDVDYSGGTTYENAVPIANTANPYLYQTERYGSSFSYNVPLPDGTYTLSLKFAETYFTQPGQRKFNVTAEGQTLLSNFDILAAAGANTAITKSFTVKVTGGSLNIGFSGVVQNAKIDAIAISGGPSAPTSEPGEFSAYLTPYPAMPTASSLTTQQIFENTLSSAAPVSTSDAELRQAIIAMYQSVGIDLSLSSDKLAALEPVDYSLATPQPLSGSYQQPLSSDAPFYHKIPANSPKVALPPGYLSTLQYDLIDQANGGDGIGVGVTAPVDGSAYSQTVASVNYPSSTYTLTTMPGALNYLAKPGDYDGHLVFIDPVAQKSLSCYHTTSGNAQGKAADYACLYTPGAFRLPFLGDRGGTNAAQIFELGYTVRPGEVTDASKPIPHALGGPFRRTWKAIVYPARATDADANTSPNANGLIPYGGLVQLDPALNLKAQYPDLPLPAFRILEAMQNYGLYLVDGGAYSDFNIHTAASGNELAPYGSVQAIEAQIDSVLAQQKLYVVPPLVKR
ncbi:malectin [Gloeobacter kilaueensis]|uniref:Malectin domain-containing protein n=1 Tax=Gloeobacter kilaueensis (strain ATCC BAA-2537 / CCAP 1431/1 / ULC 316 / JS1) TaxID=1183438 RepID=U5QK72_GLOK1|nr:malectin [Gloeobacter kilaueensis]AGY59293.1 hypothetical protein GKIL_3047 [Gloeobacter kilaueensis JS1]